MPYIHAGKSCTRACLGQRLPRRAETGPATTFYIHDRMSMERLSEIRADQQVRSAIGEIQNQSDSRIGKVTPCLQEI